MNAIKNITYIYWTLKLHFHNGFTQDGFIVHWLAIKQIYGKKNLREEGQLPAISTVQVL